MSQYISRTAIFFKSTGFSSPLVRKPWLFTIQTLRNFCRFLKPKSILLVRNIKQRSNEELQQKSIVRRELQVIWSVQNGISHIHPHAINQAMISSHLFNFQAVSPSEMLSRSDRKANGVTKEDLTSTFLNRVLIPENRSFVTWGRRNLNLLVPLLIYQTFKIAQNDESPRKFLKLIYWMANLLLKYSPGKVLCLCPLNTALWGLFSNIVLLEWLWWLRNNEYLPCLQIV